MAEVTESQERSLLAKIFVSPDEPRLRAGWRLLIYLFLWGFVAQFLSVIPIIIWLVVQSTLNHGQVTADLQADLATIGNPLLMTVAVLSALLTLAVTLASRRWLDRQSFVSLGHHISPHMITDVLFGFALGGLLMGLIYAFEALTGWLRFEGWAWQNTPTVAVILGVVFSLITYIFAGYEEELVSRGYILQNLWAGLKYLPLALLLSAAFFSALHLRNPGTGWGSVVGIFIAAFFLAYGYLRTGDLWLSTGLHFGWNFFQGTVFGFLVSGNPGFHLIQQSVNGPELITGGAFGPEAGMVSWVAMILGAALIWLYTRNRTAAVNPRAQVAASQPVETAPLLTNDSTI